MIENCLYISFIFLFLALALCFLLPFCINISDDGIDGIKETFEMLTDKDFYLNVVIPVFVNVSTICIFCNLIVFVIILVFSKINL